jgi:hypothetical protein
MMDYSSTFLPLLVLAGDPLGGVLVGGSTGLIAAFLVAALLGMALNALRRTPRHDGRRDTHVGTPHDDFREAA